MFIVWGKKHVYRRLGYVSDFCPICRKIQPFEVRRIGLAGHLYYISAGEGELVGHERTCQRCKIALEANPGNYTAILKNPAGDSELKTQTFPDIEEVLKDRLALEERVRTTPSTLSRSERNALIKTPFFLLSPRVEKRFASIHLDKEIGLALISAIMIMVLAPSVSQAMMPDSGELLLMGLMVSAVGLVVWQIAVSGRRFMKRQIIPTLAGCLRPLDPTQEELQAVLADLKQLGHKIGSKLQVPDLKAELK